MFNLIDINTNEVLAMAKTVDTLEDLIPLFTGYSLKIRWMK